jgi:hypothetical protein
MSDNQDPLAVLQKMVDKQEGEPVQSSVDDKKEQEVQAQAELVAQEKRIAELQIKEEAKLIEDQEKIAQTREEFSQVINNSNQETMDQGQSSLEGSNNDRDRKEIHQITQLKRLD